MKHTNTTVPTIASVFEFFDIILATVVGTTIWNKIYVIPNVKIYVMLFLRYILEAVFVLKEVVFVAI